MGKIKFLIVSESLAQGGNERWLYEICRAIDKEKFAVSVLCSEKYLLAAPEKDFSNFYYHELKKSGVPIYEYLKVYIRRPLWKRAIGKAKRIVQDALNLPDNENPAAVKLLQSQDAVCVIDFYNYAAVKRIVHRALGGRFFILLHSEKFQFGIDPYQIFDKNKCYKFAYFMSKQIRELAESGLDIEKNDFFYAPLVLDLSGYPNLLNLIDESSPIIIAVFSRIASGRPFLDKYIEAFARLQNQTSRQFRLHIYGEIVDREQYRHLINLIESRKINAGSIRFMGHAQDMARTIENDKVNIYWGSCSGGVLGYGSIEVVAMGVPTVFLDIGEAADAEILAEKIKSSLLIYDELDKFVAASLKLMENNDALAELSKKQREYIIGSHHIDNFIGKFERYIISIKESGN